MTNCYQSSAVWPQVLNVPEKEFMDQMGVCFVSFVSQYGYDRVLSVLGRHMRDFLNGLDNLHEYLKFSYPRMKAPSFICENETKQGLTLHYRSKRRGFVYYTMGQIREVSPSTNTNRKCLPVAMRRIQMFAECEPFFCKQVFCVTSQPPTNCNLSRTNRQFLFVIFFCFACECSAARLDAGPNY